MMKELLPELCVHLYKTIPMHGNKSAIKLKSAQQDLLAN